MFFLFLKAEDVFRVLAEGEDGPYGFFYVKFPCVLVGGFPDGVEVFDDLLEVVRLEADSVVYFEAHGWIILSVGNGGFYGYLKY